MPDFAQQMADAPDLSDHDSKQMGKAVAGKMDDRHEDFMLKILKMIDEKKIDPMNPDSFIDQEKYEQLDQEWKGKVDLGKINMANQLQQIVEFRLSKHTPDESPQLENMIEHLWEMKQRLNENSDVIRF